VVALVGVEQGDDLRTVLRPGQRFFTNFPSQPVAIVEIDGTLERDLYVFMQGWDENQVAEIQAFINPLAQWLWIGGGIYLVGGLLAFAPMRRVVTVHETADLPGGAQRA
jgi:cytochrome c-type biogenesis protein CcmF